MCHMPIKTAFLRKTYKNLRKTYKNLRKTYKTSGNPTPSCSSRQDGQFDVPHAYKNNINIQTAKTTSEKPTNLRKTYKPPKNLQPSKKPTKVTLQVTQNRKNCYLSPKTRKTAFLRKTYKKVNFLSIEYGILPPPPHFWLANLA